jgi:hypothetical protein
VAVYARVTCAGTRIVVEALGTGHRLIVERFQVRAEQRLRERVDEILVLLALVVPLVLEDGVDNFVREGVPELAGRQPSVDNDRPGLMHVAAELVIWEPPHEKGDLRARREPLEG